ncbi:hypothetical protein OROMI_006156 [Orobanche minor]
MSYLKRVVTRLYGIRVAKLTPRNTIRDKCSDFLALAEIDGNVVMVYMALLHSTIEPNKRGMKQFGFVNPSHFYPINDRVGHVSLRDRVDKLNHRLKKAPKGQFLMMPYNPSDVYFLDPLPSDKLPADLENLLNASMTLFTVDQNEKWNFSSKLRVIQDLIPDLSLLTNDFNEMKSYTTTEIDEVRVEWANHFTEILLASTCLLHGFHKVCAILKNAYTSKVPPFLNEVEVLEATSGVGNKESLRDVYQQNGTHLGINHLGKNGSDTSG